MLHELLSENHVQLQVDATDWKQAARALGELLLDGGAVEQRYLDAMVRSVEESGAYVVLTAGFALFHARPEDGVNRLCAAVMTLRQPVAVSGQDPVDVVFAFASPEPNGHVQFLQRLAELLMQEDFLDALRACTTPHDLIAVIRTFENRTAESRT